MAGQGSRSFAVVCPRPEHKSSEIRRFGTRAAKDGTVAFQRFQCRPLQRASAGDVSTDTRYKPHVFQLPTNARVVRPFIPPPACPQHPDGRVVRNGMAKPKAIEDQQRQRRQHPVVPRQRYRCTPSDGSKPHSFFPVLPRQVVQDGAYCEHCEEPTCVHRGETIAARGHRYTTAVVAQALVELGSGSSYSRVSLDAFRRMYPEDLAKVLDQADEQAPWSAKRAGQNAWRLAADWCEVFSPVLWQPWAAARHAEVLKLQEMRTKDRLVRVVIIDDIPVFGRAMAGQKPKQRFSALALSEVFVNPATGSRTSRLRLLRAYPAHNAQAYTLLLNELGYVPEVIVADGGTGIQGALKALESRARRQGEPPFLQMLSAYHVRRQLRRLFATIDKRHHGGFAPGDLDYDLETWKFCASSAAWQSWWDRFEQRARAQGVPASLWQTKWWSEYKHLVDVQCRALDNIGTLPKTTGDLEAVLFNRIKPSILGRSRGFGNLVRTNRLFDLMVLHANGQLTSTTKIARALRQDAAAAGGYGAPVRSIVDARTYRSLLDTNQLDQLLGTKPRKPRGKK